MKIGVYVCECGVNIAATVDVEQVTKHAESLPNVAVAVFTDICVQILDRNL